MAPNMLPLYLMSSDISMHTRNKPRYFSSSTPIHQVFISFLTKLRPTTACICQTSKLIEMTSFSPSIQDEDRNDSL